MTWINDEDPERALAKRAKDAGYTRQMFLDMRLRAVEKQAKRAQWSAHRRDMALAAVVGLADELWPLQ